MFVTLLLLTDLTLAVMTYLHMQKTGGSRNPLTHVILFLLISCNALGVAVSGNAASMESVQNQQGCQK